MHILIVEDEISLNDSLKGALLDANFEVEQAYNGLEGLSFALNHDFDLIILDILMPTKDGYDFIYNYTFKKEKPLPILVLSNLSGLEDKMKQYTKVKLSYMVKAEVSLDTIVKKVKSLTK